MLPAHAMRRDRSVDQPSLSTSKQLQSLHHSCPDARGIAAGPRRHGPADRGRHDGADRRTRSQAVGTELSADTLQQIERQRVPREMTRLERGLPRRWTRPQLPQSQASVVQVFGNDGRELRSRRIWIRYRVSDARRAAACFRSPMPNKFLNSKSLHRSCQQSAGEGLYRETPGRSGPGVSGSSSIVSNAVIARQPA